MPEGEGGLRGITSARRRDDPAFDTLSAKGTIAQPHARRGRRPKESSVAVAAGRPNLAGCEESRAGDAVCIGPLAPGLLLAAKLS